jgi:hypothetical protein
MSPAVVRRSDPAAASEPRRIDWNGPTLILVKPL